jgi:hypothetical protein
MCPTTDKIQGASENLKKQWKFFVRHPDLSKQAKKDLEKLVPQSR